MENDDLDATTIDGIKDDVEYYIESAADDDGSTGVDDEFDIYEELALDSFISSADKTSEEVAAILDPPISSDGGGGTGDIAPKASDTSDEKLSKKGPVAPLLGIAAIGKPQAATAVKGAIVSQVPKAASAKPTPTVVGAKTTTLGPVGVQGTTPTSIIPSKVAAATSTPPALTTAAIVVAGGNAVAAVKADKKSSQLRASDDVDAGEDMAASTSWVTAAAGTLNPKESLQSFMLGPNASAKTGTPSSGISLSQTESNQLRSPLDSVVVGSNLAQNSTGSIFSTNTSAIGSGIQGSRETKNASASIPVVGGVSQLTRTNIALSNEVLVAAHMLKQSYINSPENAEADKQFGYSPRNPYHAHTSFPTKPPSTLENNALFERLPPDALFFAFYYQQCSYQQYLAAKQLKKHSWRFHKKYKTWFQRHEEPKIATDDYEEGTYVYFDYESGAFLLNSFYKLKITNLILTIFISAMKVGVNS